MGEIIHGVWAGQEEWASTNYFWQNRRRAGRPLVVIQRTDAGEGFIEERGKVYRVPAGKAMLFGYGDESSYGYPADSSEPYRLHYASFMGGGARELLNMVKSRHGPVVPMPAGAESTRLLQECIRRIRNPEAPDRFQDSALAYSLFMALMREATLFPQEKDPLAFADDYMATRYQLPINISEVAAAAGLSREHFSRAYREQYGISPGKRLSELRMKTARNLLTLTTAPVDAIARHVGYTDVDSFSRAFKRIQGAAPLAYRSSCSEARFGIKSALAASHASR